MAFYKVVKTMQYTEECYIEAESASEAKQMSGEMGGERVYDDSWYDSDAYEIDEDEFEENNYGN